MGRIKKPPFSTVICRQSVSVVTKDELERMQKYKLLLIDVLLYGIPKANKSKTFISSGNVIEEIKRVERWLIKNWEIYLHDKNRHKQVKLKQIA